MSYQKELIIELLEAWNEFPQLRFGQFISAVTKGEDIFYMPNEQFLALLQLFVSEHR